MEIMVVIVKVIFIIYIGLYALTKITEGIKNIFVNSKDEMLNLVKIVVSVLLTFAIFKI